MRKIIGLLTLLYCSFSAFAQYPGAKGGRPANMGHLYGKVVDSDGKPVNYASVIVLQNRYDSAAGKKKEVLVKGAMTQANGDFSLEELPLAGPLLVRVSATGYKTHQQTVSFMPAKPAGGAMPGAAPGGRPGGMPGGMPSFDKDLGNIKLATDVSQLQAVTVTASKPMLKMDGEKKVFNVEKNITSAGGTALDVMRNVPSVNVDIDGNVSLRNAAPQLYVDGRPTTLTLDQIPADAIESVEVITNPSAKYDASGGGAGILNIVLKKNRKTGYNGNLRAGVDKRGALNGGGDFNLRQNKFNFSASVMGNQMKPRTSGTTERLNIGSEPQTSIFQDNRSRQNGGFIFGRLGVDWFASNRNTFSVSGIKVHGQFKPNDRIDITTDSLFNPNPTTAYSQRVTHGERTFNGNGLVLGFKHLFPKEGEELTVDGNYFGGKFNGNTFYTLDQLASKGGAVTGSELQKTLSDGSISFTTIQTDYVKPFNATTKLEAGLRASIRQSKTNNDNYIFSDSKQAYILVPNPSSHYKNSDNVYAAYVSFGSSIRNFGYKVGVRAESSEYEGKLTQTGQKFSNSYPVSLFPSLFLSQKLKNSQELQLSYTRRVNRPSFFQLIPFADSTDKLNITKGNPDLVPEFTQSLEMSYLKTFKGNHTLLASVYYKYTDNLITRFLERDKDPVTGSEALVNTYINANNSYSTGAEITVQNYLTKWWDISTNINVYNSRINTGDPKTQVDALWSMYGKLTSNFRLPASFDLQLTGTYQSKTNLPVNTPQGFGPPDPSQAQSSSQGYIRPFYGIDIAIKKSFLKSKAASVTLSVSDIFRSRKTDQYSASDYFVQNYYRLRDPQMIKLNFAYRFGKIDASLFKRKSQGGGQNIMEGMQ